MLYLDPYFGVNKILTREGSGLSTSDSYENDSTDKARVRNLLKSIHVTFQPFLSNE